MKKYAVAPMAVCGAALVATAVVAVLAAGKFSAATATDEEAGRKFSELQRIYKADVFPSDDNVNKLKAVIEELEGDRVAITNALSERNVKTKELSPSQFKGVMSKLFTTLVDKAPIVEGKKCVKPEFAFGFDRYMGENAVMPEKDDVVRLLEQLSVVDEVVEALYKAQVISIDGIAREAFETAPAANAEQARRPQGQGDKPLYTSQKYSVKFTARQQSIVDFLNSMATLKYFAVVTDVGIAKTASDIHMPALQGAADEAEGSAPRRSNRRRRAAQAEEEAAAPSATMGTVQQNSTLPPSQRLLTGPGLDAPMSVSVDFRVYRFGTGDETAKEGK